MENTPDISSVLDENKRRHSLLPKEADPVTGRNCTGDRVFVYTPVEGLPTAEVPQAMVIDPKYSLVKTNSNAWERLRCVHDFEYWAVRCARIKDKLTGADVPFRLNAPQRRVLGLLEGMRLAGSPIRLIMLKARQWGGSTNYHLLMYLNLFCNFAIWKYKS